LLSRIANLVEASLPKTFSFAWYRISGRPQIKCQPAALG
jgi:hypothetical protein